MSTARVTVQLPDGTEVNVGTVIELLVPPRRKPVMTFRYSDEFLVHPKRYAISPDLPLGAGVLAPAVHLDSFYAFRDIQPDSWGRRLLNSDERRQARATNRQARRLTDLETILRIPDETRQGALRFHPEGKDGPVHGGELRIADLDMIPVLAQLTSRIEREDIDELDTVALQLLPTGTGAGGARPKYTVRLADRSLAIAKLPSREDRWDVARWEVATARAAKQAGIQVADLEYIPAAEAYGSSIVRRFDRDGERRIGYLSAASLLQITDATDYTYEQLAGEAAAFVADRQSLGRELFRRIAFNVLTNNIDDHARNHGFLRTADSWDLAPAFDVNPFPGQLDGTPIDDQDDPEDRDIERLLTLRDVFAMSEAQAQHAIAIAASAARRIPEHAVALGATERELSCFEEVFTHPRLDRAVGLVATTPTVYVPVQQRDRLGRFTLHRRGFGGGADPTRG